MLKKILLTGVAAGSVIVAASAAHAGGFALREQSAAGQGSSFAGAAANGAGLGSMFWNPAVMTDYKGIQTTVGLTGLMPYANLTNISGTSAGYNNFLAAGATSSGDMALDAILPNTYASWQLNQNIWLGLSVNAPYGLATKPDSSYVGRNYGSTTRASSKEVTASVAYKFNEMVSLAAGVRYLDLKARYTTAAATGLTPSNWGVLGLQGDGAALGYTLGVTFKPMAGTEIGLGYRSEVKTTLKGDFFGGAAAAASFQNNQSLAAYALNNPIEVGVPLPQMVTLGLKQKASQNLTLLAGFEWTQWSVLKSPAVTYRNSGVNPLTQAVWWSPGTRHLGSPVLPFDYKDGWYASLGGEYAWDSKLTLRSGLAFESTPIKDASRSTRLPDNDRIWASIGAGYKLNEQLSLDFGYTHIFPKSTKVSILDPSNPNYKASYAAGQIDKLNADVKAHVDIISVSLTYRWDDPAPKVANKVTK